MLCCSCCFLGGTGRGLLWLGWSSLIVSCKELHFKHAGYVRGLAFFYGTAVWLPNQACHSGAEGQVEPGTLSIFLLEPLSLLGGISSALLCPWLTLWPCTVKKTKCDSNCYFSATGSTVLGSDFNLFTLSIFTDRFPPELSLSLWLDLPAVDFWSVRARKSRHCMLYFSSRYVAGTSDAFLLFICGSCIYYGHCHSIGCCGRSLHCAHVFPSGLLKWGEDGNRFLLRNICGLGWSQEHLLQVVTSIFVVLGFLCVLGLHTQFFFLLWEWPLLGLYVCFSVWSDVWFVNNFQLIQRK